MSAPVADGTTTLIERDLDVLVIGAGISGISSAYHLRRDCPDRSFAILERRARLGGTWDLFRYPGIRSDSDMHTLGFAFKPWTGEKAIADGADILAYLDETVRENGLGDRIAYGRRVERAEWNSDVARWFVTVLDEATGDRERWVANVLHVCAGYYDYDAGYTPRFEGREDFAGAVIHPQAWPETFEGTGKRVVVIGSGATAVTLAPALAETGAQVTMLQRSPGYIVDMPSVDRLAHRLRRVLPERWAYAVTRWRNVLTSMFHYAWMRRFPNRAKAILLKMLGQHLPEDTIEDHFTPTYDPWDQRVCAVPDADLFEALRQGRTSIVTDHIERFVPEGIRLESGRTLTCDVIVTATGLNIISFGGIEIAVDGRPIDPGSLITYKGMMFGNVPNMAATFGYTNASWTLKADLISAYLCRVLNHMAARGHDVFVPVLPDDVEEERSVDFTSGYILRAEGKMPKQGSRKPWRLDQNYALDLLSLRLGRVDDGTLRFSNANATGSDQPQSAVTKR